MTRWQAFHYRKGRLFCEEVSLSDLMQRFGTPCYVYSKEAIQRNFQRLRRCFQAVDPLICYAVKANSNLAILRLLKDEGSGFDVVSGGELYRLNRIDADPQRIIFSGVGKTGEELKMALQMSLLSINVESLAELELLGQLSRRENCSPRIALRINPEVDVKTHPYVSTGFRQHKFGIDVNLMEDLLAALRAAPQLQLQGLACHIGSQILKLEPFLEAFLKLKELAATFEANGFSIRHLDLGGGIGIPYRDEPELDLEAYARFVAEKRDGFRILLEPGRFLVGNAGALLNRVLYHKVNHGKHFLVVDGGMNDLIRPALYNAYHQILALEERDEILEADVVGPVCESGDFFVRDRPIPRLYPGEGLALMNAGAYGFVAASNYNSRPRVAEILVEGGTCRLIRRRETLQDLIRGEEE